MSLGNCYKGLNNLNHLNNRNILNELGFCLLNLFLISLLLENFGYKISFYAL